MKEESNTMSSQIMLSHVVQEQEKNYKLAIILSALVIGLEYSQIIATGPITLAGIDGIAFRDTTVIVGVAGIILIYSMLKSIQFGSIFFSLAHRVEPGFQINVQTWGHLSTGVIFLFQVVIQGFAIFLSIGSAITLLRGVLPNFCS